MAAKNNVDAYMKNRKAFCALLDQKFGTNRGALTAAAAALNLPYSYISHYKHGLRQVPAAVIEQLENLSDAGNAEHARLEYLDLRTRSMKTRITIDITRETANTLARHLGHNSWKDITPDQWTDAITAIADELKADAAMDPLS